MTVGLLALGVEAHAQVMAVNANSATGLNIALYSSASNYTYYAGAPGLWGNLQTNGYVEYTLAGSGGTFNLQLYFSNGTSTSGSATVTVSGGTQAPAPVQSTGSWGGFQLNSGSIVTLPAGRSTLRIAASSPVQAFNLAGVLLTPVANVQTPVSVAAPNPLFGMKFYVNPYSAAGQNTWQGCYNGQSISKIANQAQSTWFGNWNYDPASDVAVVMQSAATTGSVPILTVYNIVNRDCGGYSSGGAASSGAYQSWIQAFASGIGSRRAVVVLEPDSLTQYNTQGCLNQSQQAERINLLQYAVSTLRQLAPNTQVYLDGGPPNGISPSSMAQALSAAGVSQAAGFAVNVSNYETTASSITYGNQISQMTGGKHYVIDTSRNGAGPTSDHQWCNPWNRGLGLPSQGMASGLLDGYLWVQNPGTSDGTCNGGPGAGQFSPYIACTLLQNSAF